MTNSIFAILTIAILIFGCVFVNDAKKKHGACCGKGCRGCKVFEESQSK